MAIVLGISLTYFANSDNLHKLLRWLGITKQTSFPSEWFGALSKEVTFVVLHLKDERRLYGWPIDWPSEPSRGHFVIADPSWITEDAGESRICGVKNILIDVNDVRWVELLEKTWEKNNDQERL